MFNAILEKNETEKRARKRGEMGKKESEEERGIEGLSTADIPDVCTRLASVRTDRRKTGLSNAFECDRR
jgi:hypothetical protein